MTRPPNISDKQWMSVLINSWGNAKLVNDPVLQSAVQQELQPLIDSLPDNWLTPKTEQESKDTTTP